MINILHYQKVVTIYSGKSTGFVRQKPFSIRFTILTLMKKTCIDYNDLINGTGSSSAVLLSGTMDFTGQNI